MLDSYQNKGVTMKRALKEWTVWTATAVGLMFSGLFAATLAAPETETPKTPATTMAMLDVAYVFKNHKGFNAEMKVFEQKAQALQQWAAATEAQLKLLKTRL